MIHLNFKSPDAELMEELRIPYAHLPNPTPLARGIYMGEKVYDAFSHAHPRWLWSGDALFGWPVHFTPALPDDAILIAPRDSTVERRLFMSWQFIAQNKRDAEKKTAEILAQVRADNDRAEINRKAIHYTLRQPIRWRRCILLGAAIGGWIVYTIAVWKF